MDSAQKCEKLAQMELEQWRHNCEKEVGIFDTSFLYISKIFSMSAFTGIADLLDKFCFQGLDPRVLYQHC